MNLDTLRHSCSHVMAQAVKELWSDAKFGIGPSIENGFYYDFDKKAPFNPDDLVKIEKKMKEIIRSNALFVKEEFTKKEAQELFKDNPYKLELIKEIPDKKVSVYKTGKDFVDLCAGPHVKSTREIKVFKLLSIAGAYWRGSEKNPMLQRIYGTCFSTKEELETYLKKIEEAKARDHRKLGQDLDLFSIQQTDFGPGLVLWHPKGALIRNIIEKYWWDEHFKDGYQPIYSPHLAKLDLWKTSGHVEFYQDYMYSSIDVEGQKYITKPMNCPGHILVYKTKIRSYRDLPLRWAELGTVYRYEKSGVLHGLMRVRGFTQDDAHIFCRPDQLTSELENVILLATSILKKFGFKDYDIYVSTQPEKFVGTQENWDKATEALKSALEKQGLKYSVDPGEGVFYGPKIDIKIKDCLNRAWQCSTIQVDFNLPERFKLEFIDDKGREQVPIMVHRAILGSMERFFGVLIEHYKGAFPLWLAPVQVAVVPIKTAHIDYVKKVEEKLKNIGLRVKLDTRNETLNKKIREAETERIPYFIIIGDKEIKSDSISVRKRGVGDQGSISVEEFAEKIAQEIK